jgi:hypothetical protein
VTSKILARMRLASLLTLVLAGLHHSLARSLELVSALQQEEFEVALRSQTDSGLLVPEAYNVGNPIKVNITVKRDTECKNCPFGSCLNAGIMWAGTIAPAQCWTQGETVGGRR